MASKLECLFRYAVFIKGGHMGPPLHSGDQKSEIGKPDYKPEIRIPVGRIKNQIPKTGCLPDNVVKTENTLKFNIKY